MNWNSMCCFDWSAFCFWVKHAWISSHSEGYSLGWLAKNLLLGKAALCDTCLDKNLQKLETIDGVRQCYNIVVQELKRSHSSNNWIWTLNRSARKRSKSKIWLQIWQFNSLCVCATTTTLKGKFSSGIEGALASTLNHDFIWNQLSEIILCIFLLMFSKFIWVTLIQKQQKYKLKETLNLGRGHRILSWFET